MWIDGIILTYLLSDIFTYVRIDRVSTDIMQRCIQVEKYSLDKITIRTKNMMERISQKFFNDADKTIYG